MSKVPRLPPPKFKPQSIKPPPPPAAPTTQAPPPPPKNEEQVRAKLEDARKRLQDAVLAYRELLQSVTLTSNRTAEDTAKRNDLLFRINNLAGELDFINAGEGLMTLNLASLHSILLLKDDINDLKFQNSVLNKKIKALAPKTESK